MKQTVRRYGGRLAAAWAVFILLICVTPGRFIPSAGWMQLFSLDKIVHAALFFILASLIVISCGTVAVRRLYVWLTLSALYGFLIEVLQASLYNGRSFELLDAVADAAGVVMAFWVRGKLLRWSGVKQVQN